MYWVLPSFRFLGSVREDVRGLKPLQEHPWSAVLPRCPFVLIGILLGSNLSLTYLLRGPGWGHLWVVLLKSASAGWFPLITDLAF
jgi:hypothetical protein